MEILLFFVDLLEKEKDDTTAKLILYDIMRYDADICNNHILSRRLAFYCAKRINNFLTDSGSSSPSHDVNVNEVLTEYSTCPQHKPFVSLLTALLQGIVLRSPSALVWNAYKSEINTVVALCASPLDLLPCEPSALPLPSCMSPEEATESRMKLREAEDQIRQRSIAASIKWSSPMCRLNEEGFRFTKLLQILEELDKYNFDFRDNNTRVITIEMLYQKVFIVSKERDQNEPYLFDAPIVKFLCEWSVNTQRYGFHKAAAVAKLLDMRQTFWHSQAESRMNETRDEEDTSPVDDMLHAAANSNMPFQSLLIEFLDTQAPVLDKSPSADNRLAFANLVLLFSELIRQEVFSHDSYIATLISRGDLQCSNNLSFSEIQELSDIAVRSDGDKTNDNEPFDSESDPFPGVGGPKDEIFSPQPPGSVSTSIKSEMYSPASAKAMPTYDSMGCKGTTPQAPSPLTPASSLQPHTPYTPHMAYTPGTATTPASTKTPKVQKPNRHLYYTMHLPLPSDDAYIHEINQRLIVLYGVGSVREEVIHNLKKIKREVVKIFGKKNAIDLSNGDIGVKNKKKRLSDADSNSVLKAAIGKCLRLSYFDQHQITNSLASLIIEQVKYSVQIKFIYFHYFENLFLFLRILVAVIHIWSSYYSTTNRIYSLFNGINGKIFKHSWFDRSLCSIITRGI